MPFLVGKAGVKSTTYYVGVCLSSFQLIQGQEGSGLAGREKASTAVTSAPNSDEGELQAGRCTSGFCQAGAAGGRIARGRNFGGSGFGGGFGGTGFEGSNFGLGTLVLLVPWGVSKR